MLHASRVSGKKALIDAGLSPEGSDIKQLNLARAGILIGSAMGGMTSFAGAVEALELAGARLTLHAFPFSRVCWYTCGSCLRGLPVMA
jgi:3-oxoacyl-[acyl-carrier-protein] synthase II